jgi:putative membrane protein insertion efficiency factor
MIDGHGQRLVLGILRFYKLGLSPWLCPACRFTPTCSEYASDAIRQYGVTRGLKKTVWRVLRCHPFHRGGWDPA